MRQRTAVSLLLVTVMLGVLAPSASAKIGITQFKGAVYKTEANQTDPNEATQAGSAPAVGITEFTIANSGGFILNPTDNVKDIRVDLPPGLISNPEATRKSDGTVVKCTDAQFQSSNCPAQSRVGTVDLTVANAPYTTDVFNMVPKDGQVSDFAFAVAGVLARTDIVGGVRDTGDYGLYFTISGVNAPNLTYSKLTFFGDPGAHNAGAAHAAFIRLPTACTGVQYTKLTVTSQGGDTVTASDPTATGADGCDKVPFAPGVQVTPETTQRDTPDGAVVDVQVPQPLDPSQLASSHVKKTVVVLPPGMTIDPSAANGLSGCTDDQLQLGTGKPVACPDASKVGTVSIVTPLLSKPLTGNVYLGQPLADNPFRLFVVAEGFGLSVRLVGRVTPDPTTGQLTTTFADTPQVPFSDFILDFTDGASATLANPLPCGEARTLGTLTPYSGTADAAVSSSFTVDADGKGGACPDQTPFSLGFQAGSSNPLGGAFSPFGIVVTRADGQQYLSGLTLDQPPGLLGIIQSVPPCADAAAATGTCPDETRVGTSTVSSGAGATPFSLSGPVYLTGPYAGAPFGLAIAIHALAGPFDLGTVVVRSAIRINPVDSHLTVDTPTLPTILQGIPLRLRSVTVAIDRAGFLFNPTNCAPLAVGATLTSSDGATQQTSAPYQATGCDGLPYAPKMTALTRAAPNGGPAGLLVQLTQGAGEANSRSVSVALPGQFSARFSTLGKSCPEATFAADPGKCDPVSKVGSATAATPLLAQPLSGPVYLEAHTGGKLPTLEAILQGSGVTVDLSGDIKVGTSITSTFAAIPDVPISSFTLVLPPTPDSALQAGADLCSVPLKYTATLVGQNGKSVTTSSLVGVAGCAVKIVAAKVRGRVVRVTVRTPAGGRLTLSGRGLKKVSKTVATATTTKIRMKRTGPRHKKKIKLKVRFVPKKGAFAGGAPVNASSARKTLKFKR